MPPKNHPHFSPDAMEPLFPAGNHSRLAELTAEIWRRAGQLSAEIPSEIVRSRIASLVREMNSYYSNLIEGHKTLPRDIERAMKEDFSGNPVKRANQYLNRAHIEVEELMLQRLKNEPALFLHSADFLCWLHREFYSRLPEDLHFSNHQQGARYRIEPGTFRSFEVAVGRHHPPDHKALLDLVRRFELFYRDEKILRTNQLVAIAASHHRLAWIHPFGDGNGRVTRLFTHALLVRSKADGLGLWTLSRGLARRRQEYYEHLSNADQKRYNDLDGRGNLSDRALGEFCVFMLGAMLDQIEFMSELLQPKNLSERIERHLQFISLHLKSKPRERLARLLKAALVEGRIDRGRVSEIIGGGSTTGREIIRLGLSEGLIDSSSERGPLSLVFSSKTLESYFPQLYQDLPIAAD